MSGNPDGQNPREVEPVNIQIKFEYEGLNFLVDSSCVSTNIHISLANALAMHNKNSFWVKFSTVHDMNMFLNEMIKIIWCHSHNCEL